MQKRIVKPSWNCLIFEWFIYQLKFVRIMNRENWIAVAGLIFFLLFIALMITVYNFMVNIPDDDSFLRSFSADEKLLQFISMGFGPAGILTGVAYIMARQYGSKQIGGIIVAGGIIMFAGMLVCYSMVGKINVDNVTDFVTYFPILFMAISAPVIGVGASLFKLKKKRPKQEYF